jgi:hypothetical protein
MPDVIGQLSVTGSCALIFSEVNKIAIIVYATRARTRKHKNAEKAEIKALKPLLAGQSKRCNISLQNVSPGADNRSGPTGAILFLPASFNFILFAGCYFWPIAGVFVTLCLSVFPFGFLK